MEIKTDRKKMKELKYVQENYDLQKRSYEIHSII